MNGGMFLLTPDADTFERLLYLAPRVFSIDSGGQGFMSSTFFDRVIWLPPRFNYLRHTSCVLDYEQIVAQGGYGGPPSDQAQVVVDQALDQTLDMTSGGGGLLVMDPLDPSDPRWDLLFTKHLGSVVFLHYHFSPKPWECSLDNGGLEACGRSLGLGTSNVRKMNEHWLKVEDRCVRERETGK